MFEDQDFVVDEGTDEYKALHPNAGHRAKAKSEEDRLLQEHFQEVGPRACTRACASMQAQQRQG